MLKEIEAELNQRECQVVRSFGNFVVGKSGAINFRIRVTGTLVQTTVSIGEIGINRREIVAEFHTKNLKNLPKLIVDHCEGLASKLLHVVNLAEHIEQCPIER